MGSYFEARDIRPNERGALLSNNRSIISPLEIDNVIRQIPDVADVATVGVPDGTYGKQVVYIHSRETAECRAEHCGGLLADFKMPHEVIFRDALPKTGRGKMDGKPYRIFGG